MNKADYIRYWTETAEQEWSSAQVLFAAGNYLNALFFAHLTIEKLSKAHWVRANEGDVPPRLHNIARLLAPTAVALTPAQEVLVAELNRFQLDGRYPDYQRLVYRVATPDYTRQLLADTHDFRQCLLNLLP